MRIRFRTSRSYLLIPLALIVIAIGVAALARRGDQGQGREPNPLPTFGELLDTRPEDIGQYDLAVINLLCATGLRGSEDLDIPVCLETLDRWAEEIKRATEDRRFVFTQNADKWEFSESWWRVAFLVGYLSRVIGIEYDPGLKALGTPTDKYDTSFYKSADDVFIHGLLGPKKEGTCSSMPVLVTCVGRRMGYPLKLAVTPKHMFVKWDDPNTGEQFNVEVTDKFAQKKPDSFYMTWPSTIPPGDVERCGYLRSLSPAEEFAAFLALRGLCLSETRRLHEAQLAFSLAHRYDPRSPLIPQYIIQAARQSYQQQAMAGFKANRKESE